MDVRLHGIFAPCTSRRCLRPPALRLLHCFVCARTWSPGVRSANAKAQLRGSVVRGCGQKTYARGVVGHSRLHQREGTRVLASPIAPLGTYGCEHPASEARPATLLPASILHHPRATAFTALAAEAPMPSTAPSLAIMVQEGCNQAMEDRQPHGRGRNQAHRQGKGRERLEVGRTRAGGRARGAGSTGNRPGSTGIRPGSVPVFLSCMVTLVFCSAAFALVLEAGEAFADLAALGAAAGSGSTETGADEAAGSGGGSGRTASPSPTAFDTISAEPAPSAGAGG